MAIAMTLAIAGCGGSDSRPMPPTAPTPPTPPPATATANAYILPDATNLGALAFGDEPVVIHKGERLRWVNLDQVTHALVADTPGATDFAGTKELPAIGEESLIMTKLGTTTIHCRIHPGMVGTLIVRK